MNKIFISLLIICLGAYNSTFAQVRSNLPNLFSRGNVNTPSKAVKPSSTSRKNVIHSTKQTNANSTASKSELEKMREEAGLTGEALYRNVVRRYSWLEGQGEPISQETANHLPYYYRLSMKNGAGHWLLVEAMHGNKLTTTHPLTPYILDKQYDADSTNIDWVEQLKRVGWWLFVPDLSGENVVEERAYEAKEDNAALIYSSQIVKTDTQHATITYNDSWGMPADMNESDEYIYGSVARITYNSCGLDSIIDYLDGAGYRKSNTNGVDQERKYYDSKLRLVRHTSNNIVGDMAIDNWGNCGNVYTYDDANNSYTITRINQYGEAMRMPQGRAEDDRTFIACRVELDEWGRIAKETMITADEQADTTIGGIHRIEYSYTDDGRIKTIKWYNIEGQEIIKNK